MSGRRAESGGPAGRETGRPVFLSIVIPAYNEERRLGGTVEEIFAFLREQPYEAEVLIVENGSRDGTAALAESLAATRPALRVLREPRRGKGRAVRRGMLEARGAYRFLCDADLSMPVAQISRFLPPALTDFDVAIATREAPASEVVGEPAYRRAIGRTFNALVRALLLPGLRDTQCGFKCFRGDVAQDLFARQVLTGMAFDTEVLYIATRRRYRLREVPIRWRFDPDSRVRLLRDSLQMARDLLGIRLRARRGQYGKGL
jgi:dolichyl-phosphate beta-glucosyltransferase